MPSPITKGLLNVAIKQEIVSKFLDGLKDSTLYMGLSLISDTNDYRLTLREFENNIWDTMSIMLKVDTSMGILPVVPRNAWQEVNADLSNIEFVTNEDDTSIRLYRKVSGPSKSTEKPRHLNGTQTYADGITWEFLESTIQEDVARFWTKQHCTISEETNIRINSLEFVIYSVEYPQDIAVLTNSVSLIINPKTINDTTLTDDVAWYSHRVNLDNNPKAGAFFLRSNPDITGIITQYDVDGYGYIMSPNSFDGTVSTGQLDFNGEVYTITSFIKSRVKRMSGYTLFTQKFKKIYCNGRIKMVFSVTE